MENITVKLKTIEAILKENKAPIMKYFNSNLSSEESINILQKNGIFPDDRLLALYDWHNGLNTIYGIKDSMLELLPFGKLFSIYDAIKFRDQFIKWDYLKIETPEAYFPVFGSGEDDMYLIKKGCNEVFFLSPSALIYCEPYFNSLDKMLDTILDCYHENIFTIDPVIGLESNYEMFLKKIDWPSHR